LDPRVGPVIQAYTTLFQGPPFRLPDCLLLRCLSPACSSLGFAGTILLKSDEDMQFAQQQRPLTMFAAVGQPWQTT
jgi:hypothetical protein